jgi:formate dehydrogenase subunit gamma
MSARIAGGIVAIISAIFLIWVMVISFGPEEFVAPTVKVTTSSNAASAQQQQTTTGQAAGEADRRVQEILAARTRLMDDRTTTGEEAFPPLAAGNFNIDMSTAGAPNTRDPMAWEQNRPGDEMLGQRGDVTGVSSLPYKEAGQFQQPGGRDWRRVHNDQVRYGGGWVLFGTLVVLGAFLAARGRIKVAEGFDGRTLLRFGAFERANHWMTAGSFVLLGLTGLIIVYGKPLLIPLMGEAAFGDLAWWSVWLHMSFAIPFTFGIVGMIVVWISENLPTRVDWNWLKQGGGFLHDTPQHPPAYKFNAGQKLIFWLVVLSGMALLATGVTLMFPFYWFGYDGMQIAQTSHAVVALLMIALIFAHIYIGTIGMEGAFDAMWSGRVDWNWAKEHHSIWFRKITGQAPKYGPPREDAQPAE